MESKKAPLLGEAASCTSFYTNVTQQDSYRTLDTIFHDRRPVDTKTGNSCDSYRRRQILVYDILYSIEQITDLLRTTLVYVSGTQNDFGDIQLSVDIQADEILWQMARTSTVIHYAASEEDPVLRNVISNRNENEQVEVEVEGEQRKDDDDDDDDVDDGFIVCWDPLDGSSIVDNNWAVGTIIGVWPSTTTTTTTTTTKKKRMIPETISDFTNGTMTGRHQVTSIVAMYGPRTTVLIAFDDGTYEFTYICPTITTTTTTNHPTTTTTTTTAAVDVVVTSSNDDDDDDNDNGVLEEEDLPSDHVLRHRHRRNRMDHTGQHWICTRTQIQISHPKNNNNEKECRIFSPANLRVTTELSWYQTIVQYYMDQRYTLRYTGGLVPDLYQQFTKGMGIYMNPISPKSPPKLRLTFEVAPMALLIEKAGGMTSDCSNSNSSSSSSSNNTNDGHNNITSILDIPITSIDQRTAFCGGTAKEVLRFHTMMK